MKIERIEAGEYGRLFARGCGWSANGWGHIYNSMEFSELNKDKCEKLHYLVFADKKVHIGIVLGERKGALISGFSSPFGGFSGNSDKSVERIDEAVRLLGEYGEREGRKVTVVLPPSIYGGSMTEKTAYSLLRHGRVQWTDINYHINLTRNGDPADWLTSKAANKYRNTLKYDFRFEVLDGKKEEDIRRAYEVIKANREWRGYPLRMTAEDVVRTAPIADARFGVLTLEGKDVAAVQIHQVSDGVGQVVYWGDVEGAGEFRPMNRLAVETARWMRREGLRTLDIGPSSDEGEPSPGLCDFKESVGCEAGLKFRFEI